MSIWVCFLIGLGAGILLGGSLSFFYFQLSKTKLEAALQKESADSHAAMLQQHLNVQAELERRAVSAESKSQAVKANQELLLEKLREQFENEKETMRNQFHENRIMMENQWSEKLQVLRGEFEKLSRQHVEAQKTSIDTVNRESLDRLLVPLHEKIKDFTANFTKNNEKQTELRTSIETSIRNLLEQTKQIGKNADELTRALKADPKKQGNWGEAVLQNILDASGLTADRDYFAQAAELDELGKKLIPDIKVRLPDSDGGEEKFILIDSKVSITDYLKFTQAEDENQKMIHLKNHIQSVRKHIQELYDKNYAQRIKNSTGYVMMFIPNEGSYLLALENDPQIALDAYRKRVILLNPTNLMLALNLVHQLWQSQKQAKNVQAIIETANKIYEKFVGVTQEMADLGKNLDKSVQSFNSALSRFTLGRGNLVRSFENWKELGISSNRQVNAKLIELSKMSNDEQEI